ncbi:carbohydrate sulfotransferase 11-like [Diorhabda carinulata]|uniref:carbohydrate sulfotransferase 11-like n=1 Tax=Diorhabda carinulata TaxID=1163345 RepID=UPI0025A2476B|nr:carbohydrate sulfotransferase 11-like [Diorhabda carinulata]XP_057663030.1 carbohydrate sulfotransferase 11-like [Diorhabda carinulata]
MRLKKRRKPRANGWRVIRRCVVFFTAICIVPVLLVLMVATDRYSRPVPRHSTYVRHQFVEIEKPTVEAYLNRNISIISKRMERRREHMKNMCKLLNLDRPGNDSLHKPNPWEFLIDNKHRLIWCNIFKAASTSWMYNFNILAGYSPKFLKKTKIVPMTLARQKYPRPSLQELRKAFNTYISFLIARHPLERLLSAYRDKIQYALPNTYHKKLGNEIIKKYRYKKNPIPTQKEPTFEEFVEYLIDSVKNKEELDMHWTPIVEFCTPCMFDFQIIAHTETLQEDQMYLIKLAKLENIIQPEWKNPGRGSTENQIQKYYSQLTRSQIFQLYHIYRYDFELFNYSLNGYLEYGTTDKDPSSLLAAISMKDFEQNDLPKVY